VSARALSPTFWDGWVQDPRLWALVSRAGYWVDRLPTTALEFLDALDKLVEDGDSVDERVREGEDLDLQLACCPGGVLPLDFRYRRKSAGRSAQVAPDCGADVLRSIERGHDDSSSVGPGAATPGIEPTVEVAADMPRVDSSAGRVSGVRPTVGKVPGRGHGDEPWYSAEGWDAVAGDFVNLEWHSSWAEAMQRALTLAEVEKVGRWLEPTC